MNRAITKLSLVMDYIARWAVVAMMVLVVANVIMRQFGRPLNGTVELVGFLAALAIGLSIAYCAKQSGHIAIPIVVDRMSYKVRLTIKIITNILVVTFLAIIVWQIIIYGQGMQKSGQVSLTLELPYYPLVYIVAVGFFGYLLVVLADLVAKKESKK